MVVGLLPNHPTTGSEICDQVQVGVFDEATRERADGVGEATLAVHWIRRVQIVFAGDAHVVSPEGRGEMDDSSAVLGRDEISSNHAVCTRDERKWRLVGEAQKIGPGAPLHDRRRLSKGCDDKRLSQDVAGPVVFDDDVGHSRVDRNGLVRRKCPWRRRPHE